MSHGVLFHSPLRCQLQTICGRPTTALGASIYKITPPRGQVDGIESRGHAVHVRNQVPCIDLWTKTKRSSSEGVTQKLLRTIHDILNIIWCGHKKSEVFGRVRNHYCKRKCTFMEVPLKCIVAMSSKWLGCGCTLKKKEKSKHSIIRSSELDGFSQQPSKFGMKISGF